jgi:hypothetical protein
MTRKELFLVAVSRSPYRSGAEWAEKSLNISRTHLVLVLNGQRTSRKMTAKIDEFIAEYAPSLASVA